MGFESTITAFERAKTVHALDRAATVIGIALRYILLLSPIYVGVFDVVIWDFPIVILCEIVSSSHAALCLARVVPVQLTL
jgi:hypothetical protein